METIKSNGNRRRTFSPKISNSPFTQLKDLTRLSDLNQLRRRLKIIYNNNDRGNFFSQNFLLRDRDRDFPFPPRLTGSASKYQIRCQPPIDIYLFRFLFIQISMQPLLRRSFGKNALVTIQVQLLVKQRKENKQTDRKTNRRTNEDKQITSKRTRRKRKRRRKKQNQIEEETKVRTEDYSSFLSMCLSNFMSVCLSVCLSVYFSSLSFSTLSSQKLFEVSSFHLRRTQFNFCRDWPKGGNSLQTSFKKSMLNVKR